MKLRKPGIFLSSFIAIFIVLFIGSTMLSYGKSKSGAIILLKGSISEESTDQPIGTKMFFTNSKGKRTKTKSNSHDGTYQQPLASGETYKLLIPGYIVNPEKDEFEIPSHKKYKEIERNFTAIKLDSGVVLFKFQAFEKNDTNLIVENLSAIEDLKTIIRHNGNVSVNVIVSTVDSYFKSKKVKEYFYKKKRKRYRWKKITTEQQLTTLLAGRISELTKYVEQIKIRKSNINYLEDLQIIKPPKKKKKKRRRKKSKKKEIEAPKPELPNVTIVISRVRRM